MEVWFVGLTCWNGRGVGWETQGRRDGWTQSLMRTCLNETSFCLCLQEDSCKEDVIQQLTGKYEKYIYLKLYITIEKFRDIKKKKY